jgi:hypothetical protein
MSRALLVYAVFGMLVAPGCRPSPTVSTAPSQPVQEASPAGTSASATPGSAATGPQPSTNAGSDVVLNAWGDFPKDVFFDDPFAELDESRSPKAGADRNGRSVEQPAGETDNESPLLPAGAAEKHGNQTEGGPAERVSWAELIPAETLMEETTRVEQSLAGQLSSIAQFNEGYRAVRVDANVLAVLAGIAALHEGPIPWKERAPAIRDAAAEMATSVRGLGERFQKPALARYEAIRGLFAGKALPAGNAILEMPWSNVADRSQLMRRMKIAQEDRIKPLTADSGEFRKSAASVAREASLLAALAEVISTSYDESGEEAYRRFSRALRDQSRRLAQAARDGDFAQAAELAGANLKACNDCHAEYRFDGAQF